jgi:hypothetical protein
MHIERKLNCDEQDLSFLELNVTSVQKCEIL